MGSAYPNTLTLSTTKGGSIIQRKNVIPSPIASLSKDLASYALADSFHAFFLGKRTPTIRNCNPYRS